MTKDEKDISLYRASMRILKGQKSILENANCNPELTRVMGAIISHLDALPRDKVIAMIQERLGDDSKDVKYNSSSLDFEKMNLQELKRILQDSQLTRNTIESIAIERFKVPKGSIRSIGGKENLRDKILNMIENEITHETIALMARDQSN